MMLDHLFLYLLLKIALSFDVIRAQRHVLAFLVEKQFLSNPFCQNMRPAIRLNISEAFSTPLLHDRYFNAFAIVYNYLDRIIVIGIQPALQQIVGLIDLEFSVSIILDY